jgi:copper chaperone CopZ
MLWTATALVGAFAFFPSYVGVVVGSSDPVSVPVDDASPASAKYHIEGMTCEGCANILHGALMKLPGVKAAEVDFATKTAVVRYNPDKSVSPERVFEAVRSAGYEAMPAGKVP